MAERLALIRRSLVEAQAAADTADAADALAHSLRVTDRMSEEIVRLVAPDAPSQLPDVRSGLTGRELEIAELIALDQLTNAQLAQHLDISEKTVKTHVGSILRKLQIAQRSEIAWTLGVTQK
ncbi:LuxR C-terminal-related transcriptional regulator [Branchiibius cervicis]|uniref:LuxR C-terminal-related transcriptional regulator n=1 Tax=Branchiibius cervicis TaxID=908252 RepID=A0ABW2AQ41_9MICO